MPNVRLLSSIVSEIAEIMPSVPRQKYPEMNWRAADKVAAWKLFKW